jgi:DNA processing protein
LFYKGSINLNYVRCIAIVGTRSPTAYGEWITEQIVKQLAPYNVLIVSGLAYGIDVLAHQTALQNNLFTIGVLAHGLDRVYPTQHKNLAKEMILQGGLLTDFITRTKPEKQNFPKRNRIVAGISDAVIVIETGQKGGSMITAGLAFEYNRDVWAVPGRLNDAKSEGCLRLIKNQKAMPFISVKDMVQEMGWNLNTKQSPSTTQCQLFIEATPEEQIVFKLLQQKEAMHIDELFLRSGLSNNTVASSILQLELKGIIQSLPGKMYTIVKASLIN